MTKELRAVFLNRWTANLVLFFVSIHAQIIITLRTTDYDLEGVFIIDVKKVFINVITKSLRKALIFLPPHPLTNCF
jgi:hypothetical protein